MKTFVPFHEIKHQNVIVVDGLHPHQLTLSHWKGANTLSCQADTSGEIVIKALESSIEGIDTPLISATHFDIDGFVGVFALFYPQLALQFRSELVAMARIGDFREFNPERKADLHALKLCCWMNTLEKRHFTRPFEDKDELQNCHEKFNYFLPLFSEVLKNPEDYHDDWIDEVSLVMEGLQQIDRSVHIPQRKDLGLFIQKVHHPVHYYALFSETEGHDMVLSIYPENRYELELKYTTWVDISSRPTLPRLNLKPLVHSLNELEKSPYRWVADSVTDTGPILRLEEDPLSKVERYAHPYEREIYSSSIFEQDFVQLVVEFFENAYRNISPKKAWTWDEVKHITPNLNA